MISGRAKVLLCFLAALVVYDSRNHFDRHLIDLKRQHHSDQRTWSLFMGQSVVFNNSPLRYEDDFKAIARMIKPGTVALSDLATSYYMASYLPIYSRNVHRHHGVNKSRAWSSILDSRRACYIDVDENLAAFQAFRILERKESKMSSVPHLEYVLINKDVSNDRLREDCLWGSRHQVMEGLNKIAKKIFNGKYLVLYELH